MVYTTYHCLNHIDQVAKNPGWRFDISPSSRFLGANWTSLTQNVRQSAGIIPHIQFL